jgi:hypothetical protein
MIFRSSAPAARVVTIPANEREEDVLHNFPNDFIGKWSARHQYLVASQIGRQSDIPWREASRIDFSTIDATLQDAPH